MIRLIELFSGIGASAQAIKDLGMDYSSIQCEIDNRTVDVYNAIHGPTDNLGDIRAVKSLPASEIMTVSAPCQNVSIIGRNEGMRKGSGTNSALVWEAVRLIGNSPRPKVIVWENVKGWTCKANINEFNRLVSELNNLGYSSNWKILNAKDYGVPQSRERLFMVSILGNGVRFNFPAPCPDGRVLRDVLEDNVDESFYLKSDRVATFERRGIKKERGAGCSNQIIISGNLHTPGYWDYANRVYSIDGLAPTLCASSGAGKRPQIDINDRIRMLTPLETWRLQGFPDSAYYVASKLCGKTAYIACLETLLRYHVLSLFLRTYWTVELLRRQR